MGQGVSGRAHVPACAPPVLSGAARATIAQEGA